MPSSTKTHALRSNLKTLAARLVGSHEGCPCQCEHSFYLHGLRSCKECSCAEYRKDTFKQYEEEAEYLDRAPQSQSEPLSPGCEPGAPSMREQLGPLENVTF